MISPRVGGRGISYASSIGMCCPKGYGFSAVLAILVINRVWFLYFSLDIVVVIVRRSHFLFIIIEKKNQQKPFTNYVFVNLTLVELGN